MNNHCQACGAEIMFVTMQPSGRKMPVNAEYVEIDLGGPKTANVITDAGQVVFGSPVIPDDLFGPMGQVVRGRVTHFATCPEAKQFRRR